MNEAPTVTPSELRRRAAEICETYARHDAILAQADAADAADESKLAALCERLRQHEAACDPDRLEDFQLAAALKAQLAAMESKVAADKITRRKEAGFKARAAVAHLNLPAFFADAFALEERSGVADYLPHFESQERARASLGQSDSLNALDYWARVLCRQLPGHIIAQRLKRFVAGEVPVWRI